MGDEEEEMVTITKHLFDYLYARDEWLSCLEQAGVDNWSGWDYAHEIQEGE